jgi:hypothetical protein
MTQILQTAKSKQMGLDGVMPVILDYNGVQIRDKGEMLSLTDMWKAAGSPENREPYNWSRKEGRTFIEATSIAHNLTVRQVITKKQGRNGGTMAHWQIGLAYAKYLSPEFHMWCNQVVREHMEEKPHSVIPAEFIEKVNRMDGIMRMLAHKVTNVEHQLPAMQQDYVQSMVTAELAKHTYMVRRGKTAGQIWHEAQLPKLKNGSLWLGNRLKEMGAQVNGSDRGELGGSTARLFDPDLAGACMKNGLLHRAKTYVSERSGQSKLRLVQ